MCHFTSTLSPDSAAGQPSATPPTAAEVLSGANAILDATPTPDWWKHDTHEVLELALPEWEIAILVERPHAGVPEHETNRWGPGAKVTNPPAYLTSESRSTSPHALLRHRDDPDRWLFIQASGWFLLPGRYSTGGAWFRFDPETIAFRVGTADDILNAVFRRYHRDAHSGVLWWLLDVFMVLCPDPDTRPERGFAFDAATKCPTWVLLTEADAHLATVRDKALPASDVLAAAFPGHVVVETRQMRPTRQIALLRRPSNTACSTPDAPDSVWMLLWNYEDLVQTRSDGTLTMRGGQASFRTTHAVEGTPQDLLAHARDHHETWGDPRELAWLLRAFSREFIDQDPLMVQAWTAEAEALAVALAEVTDWAKREEREEAQTILSGD